MNKEKRNEVIQKQWFVKIFHIFKVLQIQLDPLNDSNDIEFELVEHERNILLSLKAKNMMRLSNTSSNESQLKKLAIK